MPVGKVTASNRGRAAIAAALIAAAAGGWQVYNTAEPVKAPAPIVATAPKPAPIVTPAAPAKPAVAAVQGPAMVYPPAVILARDELIKPWEGVVLKSHWDRFARIYDICYGKTRLNGKPITAGMSFTLAQCDAFLMVELYNDYYLQLVKRIPGFTTFPVSVQAAMISGAYNFGVDAMVKSSAVQKFALKGDWAGACKAQTAFNKAGGKIVNGLVKRREMGDAQRKGEAEICLSGLPKK